MPLWSGNSNGISNGSKMRTTLSEKWGPAVLKYARRVCPAAMLLVAGVAPAVAAPALPELTARVIDQYVLPRFERLDAATQKLAADLDAGCAGDPQRLSATRADFDAAVLAWAQVEFLRFGPLSVTGRPERFAFWPDPRGVMQRQLQALIARRDTAALDPAGIAKKSAAVQGLTALEALLVEFQASAHCER